MTRRVLLGTGAAVAGSVAVLGVARATHRLDDLADAVGLEPKPQPDPEDDRLVRRAASSAAALLAMVESTAARHGSLALAAIEITTREQMTAVGGATAATDVAAPPADVDAAVAELITAFEAVSRQRASDALRAFSPDLTRVLASMSAGLAQSAHVLDGLR